MYYGGIFSTFIVISCIIGYSFYRVEVTRREDGKTDEVTSYEIVDHNNPPFEIFSDENLRLLEETNFESGRDPYRHARESTLKTDVRQDGVKVSGFLGNFRSKRSLNQLTRECIDTVGKPRNTAVLVEVGERIHLPCHDCNESDSEMYTSMQWLKLEEFPNSAGLYHIKEMQTDLHDDEKKNRIVITLEHTLIIKQAIMSDAGSYFCKRSDSLVEKVTNKRLEWDEIRDFLAKDSELMFYFHVDVIDLNHVDVIDVSDYSTTRPLQPEMLPNLNIKVTTTWYPWSSCSVCDNEGIRKRIGVCSVKKLNPASPILNPYLENVLKFSNSAIPCQSEFLRDFRIEKQLQRPNQIKIEACNMPCPESARRKKRGLSFLSMSFVKNELTQEDIEKGIKKGKSKKTTVKVGAYIILDCPGSSLTKSVNWVNGTKLISPSEVKILTNKRIFMDMFNNLHFQQAIKEDAGTYSCWIKKKLMKVFEVKVAVDRSAEIWFYTKTLCVSFLFDFFVFVILVAIRRIHKKIQIRKRARQDEERRKREESDSSDEDSKQKDMTSDKKKVKKSDDEYTSSSGDDSSDND